MLERIQKILSARGIASRRKAEEYIEAGLVTVNGTVAVLGQKADPVADNIEVNGKVISDRQRMLYYLIYKPVGIETHSTKPAVGAAPHTSKDGHATGVARDVRDLLPSHLQGAIYPVGRLDKDSEGLLLLTNDGVLAYRLTHPTFLHEKEYEVTVDRRIPDRALAHLQEGMMIDGSMTKPLQTSRVDDVTFRIILTEGRNRQIRRMTQHVGYTVKRLRRIRIQTLIDARLRPGEVRALTVQERGELLMSVGIKLENS